MLNENKPHLVLISRAVAAQVISDAQKSVQEQNIIQSYLQLTHENKMLIEGLIKALLEGTK
jgi:hypothetical protein